MTQGLIQIALTLLILIAIVPFFGGYMAKVYLNENTFLDPVLSPIDWLIYRLSGVRFDYAMTGWQYARAVLWSNLAIQG